MCKIEALSDMLEPYSQAFAQLWSGMTRRNLAWRRTGAAIACFWHKPSIPSIYSVRFCRKADTEALRPESSVVIAAVIPNNGARSQKARHEAELKWFPLEAVVQTRLHDGQGLL